MAETMKFDLVSPERKLLSAQATEVQIPGADGDLTAMPGHAPTITTLRPGVLRVIAGGQTTEFAVTGGFAEISADGVAVLAERALSRADMTQSVMDAWVAEARKAHKDAATDENAKTVADMQAIAAQVGLNAAPAA